MTEQSIEQTDSLLGRSIGDHDRYRIDAHLGQGGMGEVYQATDARIGKSVAIKLLKTSSVEASTSELEFRRRFERECAICASLKSENIVQVSDYGITAEGYPFYVMEYLEGETLQQILKQQSKLSVERTKDIILQVCAGLQSAHEGVALKTSDMDADRRIKVVHCDLKPANIFLVPTILGERVKVIDFGVAKIQSLHIENSNLPKPFLGTYHYAAPEQFEHQIVIDERVDIYCLGIVLYEMLAGGDPFGLKVRGSRVSNEAWIKAHLFKSVQPLRSQPGCESLPIDLEQIVMRCLEKSPENRFPSVQALAQALDAVQNTPRDLSSSQLSKKNSTDENNSLNFIPSHLLAKFVGAFKNFKENEASDELSSHSLQSKSPSEKSFVLSVINSDLIDRCHAELAIHIGPIAKLIIERTLRKVNYQQSRKFIDELANSIPDLDAANRFRKTFLESNQICLKQK
jgi:eukaryotic-like serine/threonine-protein kinase